MAYSKQTWTNGPDGNTPLSAARLDHIEDGIEAAAITADAALPATGGEVTGAVTVDAVDTDNTPPSVLGGANGDGSTGLNILSSFDGGEDDGTGTDTTGRLNLFAYQRASTYSFGENIRHFMMRGNAKSMDAWWFPDEGYDANLEPVGSFKPVVWTGAHWQANDGLSNHKHWSIETPDSTGAIQTRFEVRFGDPDVTDAIGGLDKTLIMTNLADFVVRCTNGQEFRLAASVGTEKAIMFSHDSQGAAQYARWKVRATGEAETGSDAGTNFQITRYNDSGVFQDAPVHIARDSGNVGVGGTVDPQHDLHVEGDAYATGTLGVGIEPDGATAAKLHRDTGGTVLAVTNDDAATLAGLVTVTGANGTRRAFQAQADGDTISRFSVETSGKIEWGAGGSSPRDVTLNRASTGQLRVTPSANASNSTSVGGALNITNSASTGAGLVVYSDQAAPVGHLIAARANNASFSQSAVFCDYVGTGHAVTIDHSGTGASSSALNVASTNTDNSAVGISGAETGKGTLKVTHTGTGSDANAAGLSIDLAGTGTAAQGVYVDATDGGTTGNLLRLRNNGVDQFVVSAAGGPGFYGATPTAKPEVTGSRTDGTALASLLTALETLGLITDSSTA